jgi:hypothetical protein
MNAPIRWLALGTAMALAGGCGSRGEGAAEAEGIAPVMAEVDRAVATARAIQAEPAATDSILAAHGLTRAGFDSLMYAVAADPALARAYAEGVR